MLYYEKICLFKASGRLRFSLFIINRYCTLRKIVHYCTLCSTKKNVCSKRAGRCFLVYSPLIKRLMFYFSKCVFKARVRWLFSLLIYCSTSKNVELYFMLVFRKFAQHTKSAVILRYEGLFYFTLNQQTS